MTGMSARLHDPPRALRPCIAHIWELSGRWTCGTDLLLPDTAIDICVQLHGEVEFYTAGRWSALPARAVVGSLSHAVMLRPPRQMHAFGIRLHAGAARLLQLPAAQLRDVICPLAEVAPALDRSLEVITASRVTGGLDVDSLWQELGRWVNTARHGAAERAAWQLANLPAVRAGSIAALASQLGISRRHLARSFSRAIGWTPEEFRRLARFSAAAALASTAPVERWSDVALAAGYFDQAHFIRDFRSFTARLPTTVFSAQWYSNFSVEARRPG